MCIRDRADVAVTPQLMAQHYPFSQVSDANVLVFPDLDSANVAYKLVPGFTITPEVRYEDNFDVDNTDEVSGFIRFQRNF